MHTIYDPEYAQRFWRVLLQVDRVFKHFRTGFLGKVSPVHMFWESVDMAVTRFSGRRAPQHPGGVPSLRTLSPARRIHTKLAALAFGPVAMGLTIPRFTRMLIRSPRVLIQRRYNQETRSTIRSWVSSFCLTMPCATPKRRMKCYWSFYKAPMKPRLKPVGGTESRSSVCWANPVLVPEIPGKT
jgi:hypothetical protein